MIEVYFVLLALVLLTCSISNLYRKRRFEMTIGMIEKELERAIAQIRNPILFEAVRHKYENIKTFIIFLFNPNDKNCHGQIKIEAIEGSREIDFKLTKSNEIMHYYLKI